MKGMAGVQSNDTIFVGQYGDSYFTSSSALSLGSVHKSTSLSTSFLHQTSEKQAVRDCVPSVNNHEYKLHLHFLQCLIYLSKILREAHVDTRKIYLSRCVRSSGNCRSCAGGDIIINFNTSMQQGKTSSINTTSSYTTICLYYLQ